MTQKPILSMRRYRAACHGETWRVRWEHAITPARSMRHPGETFRTHTCVSLPHLAMTSSSSSCRMMGSEIMARYINLDKQLVRLYLLHLTCEDVIKEFLLSADTADVVERKKGRWNTDKESPEYATCSVCGHCDWDCTESEYFKYCPNCGAQMGSE